jgi:hypothetical protein
VQRQSLGLWAKRTVEGISDQKSASGNLGVIPVELLQVGSHCCKQAWVLKNSFRGISRTKFARKLLKLRLPQALKFTQITALVPFSTATGDSAHHLEWLGSDSGRIAAIPR